MSQNARGLPEWSEDVGILKDNYGYDKNGNVNTIADQREGISNRSASTRPPTASLRSAMAPAPATTTVISTTARATSFSAARSRIPSTLQTG
jgi:hypothetical protein